VKFIASIPFSAAGDLSSWCEGGTITDWAVAAEAAGFDAVAVTDHPFPTEPWLAAGGHHAFDPFVILTAFGVTTRRIRLLTDVLVAGYRNPYLAAKSIASLDVLTGGRLTVGIAAGYQKGEFDALGASFHDRGARFDGALVAMTAAFSGEPVTRYGTYFPASGNVLRPRPVQQPRPSIWIGGNAPAAVRRAVHLADGWMPFAQAPSRVTISKSPSLQSLEELAPRIEGAQKLRAEAGKPPLEICSSIFERGLDPDALLARAADYEAVGVTWVRTNVVGKTLSDTVARMEAFRAARAAREN
jgi:probable F420-dependent oxidoreductase